MDISKNYDKLTEKVEELPTILKDLIFDIVIEHRNLFTYFLINFMKIYEDRQEEWGRYDAESLVYGMQPSGAAIDFKMGDHTFEITFSGFCHKEYDCALRLFIDNRIALTVFELPDQKPMVRYIIYNIDDDLD